MTTMKHLLQECKMGFTIFFSVMGRSTATSFLFRGGAAALAALLLSAAALAAPRPVERASCCQSVEAPMSCCGGGGDPAKSSASCCRLSASEEAAPSLRSLAVPVLEEPAATVPHALFPALDASLAGHVARIAPRARSAPLHVLHSVFLV